jgi:hypothetical protein
MARSAKIIVALLCIACVLALCIAPYVDIPVTALRSLQTILLLMFALAGALVLADVFSFGSSLVPRPILKASRPSRMRSFLPPIEANCVQQC